MAFLERCQWLSGVVLANELRISGDRVVSARGAAIGDPTGGSVVDSEARASISFILSAMRAHGLISG